MAEVMIGIGIPGSGKSTLLKKLATEKNMFYICPDDIRVELTGDPLNLDKMKEVWSLTKSRIANALKNNLDIIVDATFAKHNDRKQFTKYCKEAGADRVLGLWLRVDPSVAKQRNHLRAKKDKFVPEYVIDRMYKNLKNNPPSLSDGFDEICIFDENAKLVGKLGDGICFTL